jgi:hypothetical protein
MLTLIYGPDGENVNDFNYQEWIDNLIEQDWINEDIEVRVSSQLPIALVQVAILKEQILHEYVQFKHHEDGPHFDPSTFDMYGKCRSGVFLKRITSKMCREYLQLERKKRAEEDKRNRDNLICI